MRACHRTDVEALAAAEYAKAKGRHPGVLVSEGVRRVHAVRAVDRDGNERLDTGELGELGVLERRDGRGAKRLEPGLVFQQ